MVIIRTQDNVDVAVNILTGEHNPVTKYMLKKLISSGVKFDNVQLNSDNEIEYTKDYPAVMIDSKAVAQCAGNLLVISARGDVSILNKNDTAGLYFKSLFEKIDYSKIQDTSELNREAYIYNSKRAFLGKMPNLFIINESHVLYTTYIGNNSYDIADHTVTIPKCADSLYKCSMFSEKVKEIRGSENLRFIGAQAFHAATGIDDISSFVNLEGIGSKAFLSSGVKRLHIHSKLSYIADHTFNDSDLEIITADPHNVHIGCSAFERCKKLKHAELPEGMVKIDFRLFAKCQNLKTIKIPSTCTSIENEAFLDCYDLQELVLPENLSYFDGGGVLRNCMRLKKLVLPKSIKQMRDYNFNSLIGLKELHIPKKLVSKNMVQVASGCTVVTY